MASARRRRVRKLNTRSAASSEKTMTPIIRSAVSSSRRLPSTIRSVARMKPIPKMKNRIACAKVNLAERVLNTSVALAKFVADAPNGLDELRLVRISLDLGAQSVDVRIHRVLVSAVRIAPDAVEQLRSRKDPARMASEVHQQIEFLGRQFDEPSGDPNRPFLEVDVQIAGLQHGICAIPLFRQIVNAAKYGLDPRRQLQHAEWLGQIVVRSHFKPEHAIEFA